MSSASTPKILVIDEDPRDRKLLRRILENAGHYVSECGTYLEAEETIRSGNFDAVVLNLGALEGAGFDVLRALQSIQPLPKVIVTTGYPKPVSYEIFESATQLGAVGAIDKLEAQESLVFLVRDVLKLRTT
jgi:two-component system, NarL family, response regulator EvgA